MKRYQAILFDLDDTLLDRSQAIDELFSLILEKCYEGLSHTVEHEMLKRLRDYDKRSYGKFDKTIVLESFFNEYPPKYRLPRNSLQDFWDDNFPLCFSISQNTLNIINAVNRHVKIAIVSNGFTQRQKAKIINTNLHSYFNTIIISEEVGFSEPDKRIFELVLNELHVQPDATLFVGDDLEKDIAGCQSVNIKGIWFNPHKIKNDTEIKPYVEIYSFDSILSYII